jgi:peroxiredoxin
MKKHHMKKSAFLLFTLCFSVLIKAQQSFEIINKKPVPGSVITIEYMPRSTVLQGVKDFEATAYLLEGKLPLAKAISLKQEGGVYKGTVKTNDTTRAVFFSFAKDDKKDNNNDSGYYTLLYNKQGVAVPGSRAAAAAGFSNYGGIWGLKRNVETAARLNETEFAVEASRKQFIADYISYLAQSKDTANQKILHTALAGRLQDDNISEADLNQIKFMYQNTLKNKAMSDSVGSLLKRRYPASFRQTELLTEWNNNKTLSGKEAIYEKFVNEIGSGTESGKRRIESLIQMLATMYADSGNYEAAKKYLSMISDKANKANTLNSIAWKLSGEGLHKKPVDVKAGLPFSEQSLTLIKEEKKAMSGKPPYLTEKQYVKNLDGSYNMFADTYATLLYHNGEFQKAYDVEKAAVAYNKRKDVSMNEAFALLTEKVKGPKAAQAELESFFEEGKYSPAMKEQLKTLYLAAGKTEAQWTAYATDLEARAYNKLKAELAKTMINIPAPQFALKDMSGKEVALSSFKGKTVVVDFWATWCGPCVASFPGMQMAVNKFKDNPDVVFLFIDTWENDSNRVQKVTDFIAKNKYTFNVLYDDAKAKEGNAFVVVEDFKVEGIPTKFVIDRNSNIRFKTVGFSGSADAVVSELTAMIDMADAESGGAVKKAF